LLIVPVLENWPRSAAPSSHHRGLQLPDREPPARILSSCELLLKTERVGASNRCKRTAGVGKALLRLSAALEGVHSRPLAAWHIIE